MHRRDSDQATARAERRKATEPTARSAWYDQRTGRVVIALSTGLDISFPSNLAQGLEKARPDDLDIIEITPSGFGLHFPKLDADLYLPGLLEGFLGSKHWMAARLGARGGQSKSKPKAKAARANGKLGGRPKRRKTIKKKASSRRRVA